MNEPLGMSTVASKGDITHTYITILHGLMASHMTLIAIHTFSWDCFIHQKYFNHAEKYFELTLVLVLIGLFGLKHYQAIYRFYF